MGKPYYGGQERVIDQRRATEKHKIRQIFQMNFCMSKYQEVEK